MYRRRLNDPQVWWFGLTWDAPICTPETEAPTPVGAECAHCTFPIRMGDRGLLTSQTGIRDFGERLPFHLDCFLREIVPPPHSRVWDQHISRN